MRLLGALAMFAACAGTQPYVVSGESLKLVGTQFIATAALMNDALNAKRITTEQYGRWVVFGKKFKISFDLAVQLWETARATNDAILERQAADIITRLAGDLTSFYEEVRH